MPLVSDGYVPGLCITFAWQGFTATPGTGCVGRKVMDKMTMVMNKTKIFSGHPPQFSAHNHSCNIINSKCY